jgi:hypothetical protein
MIGVMLTSGALLWVVAATGWVPDPAGLMVITGTVCLLLGTLGLLHRMEWVDYNKERATNMTKGQNADRAIARGVVEAVRAKLAGRASAVADLSGKVETAVDVLNEAPEGDLLLVQRIGDVWIVGANEDKTEGRGRQVVEAVAEKQATAVRLARGASVQGSDGEVARWPLLRVSAVVDGEERTITYGPVTCVRSTVEDDKAEARLVFEEQARVRRDEALARAREKGLTAEDIETLRAYVAGKE